MVNISQGRPESVRQFGLSPYQQLSNIARLLLSTLPCSSRDVPSGMYLINVFLRRYIINPYKGEASVYAVIALRASDTPCLPRPSNSTESLEVYLSRNLRRQLLAPECHDRTYQFGHAPSTCICDCSLIRILDVRTV